MTVFLLPWAALAVPLATSVYPGLSERADRGDEAGFAATLAPATVLTVVTGAVAAAGLVAYFVGAVLSHLRVRDTKGLAMPLVPLALSVAVLVLRIVTA